MAHRENRKGFLNAFAKRCLKDLAATAETLQANPWWKPLMAAQTKENAIADAEKAGTEEWQRENQKRWLAWRHGLSGVLSQCRCYVTECKPERMIQLEKSQLWQVANLPDSTEGFVEREKYTKGQCLEDLAALRVLVRHTGRYDRSSRKQQDICKRLKNARGTDTEEQAAAAINKILKELGSTRKKPLGQPQYHGGKTAKGRER